MKPISTPRRIQIFMLAASALFCAPTARSQSANPPANDGNQSWTDTTELQSDNANPTRIVESHHHSGNQTSDNRTMQRRNLDGRYEAYQDVEKTSVQVDASTVRTTTRTFVRDGNGARVLLQVTEEEIHSRPGDDSYVVRGTSSPDVDGRLQLIQREIEEIRQSGKDVKDIKTTTLLPSADGRMVPAKEVREHRTQTGADTVESQKTTLMPNLDGRWQTSEVRHATMHQSTSQSGIGTGKETISDEQVSRPDADGRMEEVGRTVRRESETAPGETSSTVEDYSVDIPGSARDGGIHLVQRSKTVQRTSSSGQKTTQGRVEQPNPGDPNAGLRVSVVSNETVTPGASGARTAQTVEMHDGSGATIVSMDATTSDNNHAVEVQIAPATKPK